MTEPDRFQPTSLTTITVEIEGEGKPALVADWIGRTVYDS